MTKILTVANKGSDAILSELMQFINSFILFKI